MADLTPDQAAALSAAPLARAYLAGDADPVDVTETFLARIAEADGSAVFISTTPERARREAKAARARYHAGRPASPLDGVPVAWKDLFDVAGTVTTAGSALWRDNAPETTDAPVVAQLAGAGMVCLGKTNMTEFAYSGLGLNPHYGTPANPYDAEVRRAPGGSSAGSAVAVAAGLSTTAIGSDTGGSVRVPAAFNGLVGYKSSEGRISTERCIPLSWTLDTVGPLARTVEDCVQMDAALRGAAPAIRRADISGVRLVVSESLFLEDCEDTVVTAFEEALKRLEAAGARIEWRTVPELDDAHRQMAEHGTIAAAEAYAYHRERIESPDVEDMDGRVVARLLRGKTMTAHDLVTLMRGRKTLARSLRERLDGAFLAGPTVAHGAPEIAPLDADPEVFARVNLKTLRNTMAGNFLDLPGVTIPMPSRSPLPAGLLISGSAGEDEGVLSAALAAEGPIRGD